MCYCSSATWTSSLLNIVYYAILSTLQIGHVCIANTDIDTVKSIAEVLGALDPLVSLSDAAFPSEWHQPHHDAWINSGKYQGDIAGFEPSETQRLLPGIFRNAVKDRTLRWAQGIVPYVLAPMFTAAELQVIRNAMETYHQKTCIRFVPRSAEIDYLYIFKDYGCYSLVGRVGGRQELSLGRGCLFHEIAVHELMHSLGFWHEHSRADRDQNIAIQWPNVIPNMRSQFDKIDFAYSDFLDEPYDYYSVMHYDSRAFSRNGRDTIVTTVPGFTTVIGKALDLSAADIRKVNKLYDCRTSPPTTTSYRTTRYLPTPETPTQPPPLPSVTKPAVDSEQSFYVVLAPLPNYSFSKSNTNLLILDCPDRFLDCPFFYRYCSRESFYFVMKLYCPKTCGHCNGTAGDKDVVKPSEEFRAPEDLFRILDEP